MAVMRSCFYIPGNVEKMVSKAPDIPADILIFDLEDSVPPPEKAKARRLIRDNLEAAGSNGSTVYCRVNNWETCLTGDDLEAVVYPGLGGVVLAKCDGPDHVRRLDWRLEELEWRRGLTVGSISVQLQIESAVGLINAHQSALASPRVNSLAFGTLDYAKDMRLVLSVDGRQLLFARSHLAVAARAARCLAIDSAFVDYKNMEGFEKDTLEGHSLGFEGRMLIHPAQVEPAHRLYAPSADQIAWARGLVEAFEAEALAKGLAAIAFEGKMVDTPVYESALGILAVVAELEEKDRARARAG
jgi:citrate lyase subunit beta/citryl-CoA lyase